MTTGISNENSGFSEIFGGLIFKWTYLGAQEELDGQMVIVTYRGVPKKTYIGKSAELFGYLCDRSALRRRFRAWLPGLLSEISPSNSH